MDKPRVALTDRRWDVFMSYASEDRGTIVRPICRFLLDRGVYSIWLDQKELTAGLSLSEQILQGIGASSLIAFIITKHSIKKLWPRRERQEAWRLAKETVIITSGVGRDELLSELPWAASHLVFDLKDGARFVGYRILQNVAAIDNSAYHRDQGLREEQDAFWAMIRLYLWKQAGLLDPETESRLAHDGGDWMAHAEQQLGGDADLVKIRLRHAGAAERDEVVRDLFDEIRERTLLNWVRRPTI